jgi:hypothetical protein
MLYSLWHNYNTFRLHIISLAALNLYLVLILSPDLMNYPIMRNMETLVVTKNIQRTAVAWELTPQLMITKLKQI